MFYYTQLIFIKPNAGDQFNLFESRVLPLLKKYDGTLLYRVRPTDSCVIEATIDHPYEIHLVTFPTRADFEGYSRDKERLAQMPLKEASVESGMLIEGQLL